MPFVDFALLLRNYDEDGRFIEVAWSRFQPTGSTGEAEDARRAA
jgi:hypothetical protein